jgi:hypothetical protein
VSPGDAQGREVGYHAAHIFPACAEDVGDLLSCRFDPASLGITQNPEQAP